MLNPNRLKMLLTRARQPKLPLARLNMGLLIALALGSPSFAAAADTACEVTLPGGTVDTRDFPVTPGATVLNGNNRGQTELPPIKRTDLMRGTSPLILYWANVAQK